MTNSHPAAAFAGSTESIPADQDFVRPGRAITHEPIGWPAVWGALAPRLRSCGYSFF